MDYNSVRNKCGKKSISSEFMSILIKIFFNRHGQQTAKMFSVRLKNEAGNTSLQYANLKRGYNSEHCVS